MSKVWIPPGDYREGVKEILHAPGTNSDELSSVLFDAETEDLEEALKILDRLQFTKTKTDRIRKELEYRKNGKQRRTDSPWDMRFIKQWNEMRKAAGKI